MKWDGGVVTKREITEVEAFNRAIKFSEKYVQRGPYEFFPELEVVTEVQKGLGENERLYGYRYCPWMPLSGDPVEDRKKICPCDRHHEDIQRDGFCIWMFFVSEEFLRKYQAGEEFTQTIDEAVAPGQELFDEYESKADFKAKQQVKSNNKANKGKAE